MLFVKVYSLKYDKGVLNYLEVVVLLNNITHFFYNERAAIVEQYFLFLWSLCVVCTV